MSKPDFARSPYTGMDRNEWLRAGRHILEGAFSYVKDLEDPMFLPKFPGKSYPREGNENASAQSRRAAIFEAIARTFNVASPLIAENPDIEINGIRLADYYRYHFLKLLTDPSCDYYIGNASDYSSPVQQTCELGNLAAWFLLQPQSVWNRWSKAEQDAVAKTFGEWAEGKTNTHNWRLFNVMMLAFLNANGYPIDRGLMNAHVDNILLHYAGNGWFRDSDYDYYSMHAFGVLGAVWSRFYGRENEARPRGVAGWHLG